MDARRAGLVLAAVLIGVAAPASIVLAILTGETFVIAWNTAFIAYAVVGLLILWKRPGNGIGRLFLMLGLVVPVAEIAAAYAEYGLPGAGWAALLSSMSNPLVFGSLFLFLPLLFPSGTFLSPRWRRFGIVGVVLLAAGTLLFVLTPGPLDCCPGIRNPIDVPSLRGLQLATPFVFPAVVLTAFVAFASLLLRYRRSSGEERLQMKWFTFAVGAILLAAIGGSLASLGLVVEEGSDLVPIIVFPTAAGAIAVAVGIAILRYRLYDIDLVISRTLVYGSLAAFITAVYVGVVVGIGTALGTRGESNLGLQVAATALVAVAFQPVRTRVQGWANRLVYGERATPYEVMSGFGERMAASLQVEEILPRMAEMAARGVGGTSGRVRLFLPGGAEREATWPSDAPPGVPGHALAVTHRGEPVGEIAVAKALGDPLRPDEERLLQDLAAQAGLALHNVQLTAELEARLEEIARQAEEVRASQQRIVTAADEGRRRLERIIEDRVERRLERMTGEIRAILRGSSGGEEMAGGLEAIRDHAQGTLEDLRDIARGIYPPLLADRGLPAALEAQVRKAALPVRLRIEDVGRYAQEVEAGVYFCCLEALRGGSELMIALGHEGGGVRLTIEDRGALEAERVTRIRDRIEALGGTLKVEGDRGTVISAVIPAAALEPAS